VDEIVHRVAGAVAGHGFADVEELRGEAGFGVVGRRA
jgi:hypothetical protein